MRPSAIHRINLTLITMSILWIMNPAAHVFAHFYPWTVRFPDDIRVIDNSSLSNHQIAFMINDYNVSIDGLTLSLGAHEPHTVGVTYISGQFCWMGKWLGLTVPETLLYQTGGWSYLPCLDEKFLPNGTCDDGDNRVGRATVYINECHKSWYGWHGIGNYDQRIATHEMGHVLGLTHPDKDECEITTVMHKLGNCGSSKSNFPYALTSHDISDLNSLYP